MQRTLELAPGVSVLPSSGSEPIWYDGDAAGFVEEFFSLLCYGQNEWAGKPFVLEDWEKDAIHQFYGVQTLDDSGYRIRYRRFLYVEIAKKNGKSEFAAGLGLFHLLADGEKLPIVSIYAADKTNAGIIYNAAKYMVENCAWMCEPAGDPLCWAVDSLKEIHCKGGGVLKVMSSESYSKHGYSPSCIIIDELHAQRDRKLWDFVTFGSNSARRQQTVIVLTTAGNDPDRHSVGWEVHEKCRRLLSYRAGTPERELDGDDPDWCPIMYGISILTGDDPDKIAQLDIYDEKLWARCNPALGVSVKLRDLRREAAAARQSDGAERLFRWLRLNQWISTDAVSWISVTLYDKTQWNGDLDSLRGKTCYGGVDLSATTDLTAFALLFPPQEGLDTWVELVWGWVPTDDLEGREQRDHVPFRDWIRAGFLRGCPGSVIDYEDVIDTIYDAEEQYDMKLIGFDPWLSRTITQRLEAGDPAAGRGRLPVAEIPQDMKTLAPITKLLRELILKHEMLHVHNTAARWCFNNVRCYEDINGNQKPNKKKSTGRIDMTMAWVIALATAVADMENGPGYDKENLGEDWGI